MAESKEKPTQNLEPPPPLYGSERLGTFSPDKKRKFDFVYGFDKAVAGKLLERSADKSDEALHAFTKDGEQFKDAKAYEEWYAAGRFPFGYVGEDGSLAAASWFAEEPLPQLQGGPAAPVGPGEWDAVSFRSYPPHRGTGIMDQFGALVVASHKLLRPGRGLWLKVKTDNAPAIPLYEKLGFRQVGRSRAQGDRIIMVLAA